MTTHLICAPVDMRGFNRWAADRGFVRRGTFDEGFALHVLLSGTFGKAALKPFRLFSSDRQRTGTLYAYADRDSTSLRDTADTVATPDCLAALDVRRLLSKEMRTDYYPGQRLGFDIRLRPVRRLHREIADGHGLAFPKGSEVDAFLAQVLHDATGPASDAARNERSSARREAIYLGWLDERLGDAAEIDTAHCRLAAFRRSRAIRGDGLGPEGPDATIHGVLTVRNPEQFANCVKNGVGRHKAYGFGMLLLRPPGAASRVAQV